MVIGSAQGFSFRYVTKISQSCESRKVVPIRNKKKLIEIKVKIRTTRKNLLTTGWVFCVCDSGKKVGLGLGNLPAQDVQPVKTCHDASGIDRCITGELHLLLAAILPFVTT